MNPIAFDPSAEAKLSAFVSESLYEGATCADHTGQSGASTIVVDPFVNPLIAAAKILIIDDETSNVRLLEKMLARAGCHNFISTTDSREALALFRKHEPDLVLTDWMMPDVDGHAVLRQLREWHGATEYLPIVVLTADMTPETKRKALSAGATDFLTKPFSHVEVLLRIGNLLQSRAAHLKIQEQNASLEAIVRERTIDLETALTDLRNAQQQVVQQERLAALGTMAGGIAHDFNNSLCAIVGFSELLLRDSQNGLTRDQAAGPLATILTAAEDASQIVARLRDFYRDDQTVEVRHPVRLNKLVEQAISLTQPKWQTLSIAAGREINVQTDLAETSMVGGNAAELREVLTNLIFNAVDAMPDGGTLTLRTATEGDTVVIEVRDTGSGMSEETQQRCLEPFFTTKGKSGTGLGLAMVFGIMQRHGGSVEIQSVVGNGTTFSLRLPASDVQTEAALVAAEAFARSLHILVVDDQPILSELLCHVLENDLHTVESAAGGLEALQKFDAGQFDLVITDQVMTGMNGQQLAAELKSRDQSVPVILLTGFGEGWAAENESASAIDMVVAKPFSRSDLRDAMMQVVAAASLETGKLTQRA